MPKNIKTLPAKAYLLQCYTLQNRSVMLRIFKNILKLVSHLDAFSAYL